MYLTVNKADATAAAAAVNLYPISQSFTGKYALKFDMWLNWASLGSSTEHALFGVNHTGNVANRIGQPTSDGLFFTVAGDGGTSATSTTLRDFGVFCGGGSGAIPMLRLTSNTAFGPTPPLGPQFDNTNPGFTSLFPAKPINGGTPAGSPGLGWVSGEVRQENDLITCLLNGVAIAQYTNTFDYTNGNIMVGYNDNFGSIGDASNFVLFDNIRVESVATLPVKLHSSRIVGSSFSLSFTTQPYERYTVQRATDLLSQNWVSYTNFAGDGTTIQLLVPLLPSTNSVVSEYFRVSCP